MKKTGAGITHLLAFFLIMLMLAAQICMPAACADDAETLAMLPGEWRCTDETEKDGEAAKQVTAVLSFEESGAMSLHFSGPEEKDTYFCAGTWSFEFVPDGMDRLTLLFTSTDQLSRIGSEYGVECVYSVYTESWVENDTEYTALILDEISCSGVSPFEEMYGWNGKDLYREQGPNMRVVNCQSYVSLREERSTKSVRLAKVPLGALVLAYPDGKVEDGFIACYYQDEYGYILAEYLEPAQ